MCIRDRRYYGEFRKTITETNKNNYAATVRDVNERVGRLRVTVTKLTFNDKVSELRQLVTLNDLK